MKTAKYLIFGSGVVSGIGLSMIWFTAQYRAHIENYPIFNILGYFVFVFGKYFFDRLWRNKVQALKKGSGLVV